MHVKPDASFRIVCMVRCVIDPYSNTLPFRWIIFSTHTPEFSRRLLRMHDYLLHNSLSTSNSREATLSVGCTEVLPHTARLAHAFEVPWLGLIDRTIPRIYETELEKNHRIAAIRWLTWCTSAPST